ncbi:type II toxin-antitoxin system antitoxin CcdA [Pectobacterium brasiliense]|uniref:type II toxin-antitoxin system antitoxin CcdA n=1 Tax=Pectobacterium brasiliense TaxID=180957 RepID=UPI00057E85F7|nr:type II toxin-antitoxin system antitoxin CcdA [Pectobacterium brasiliense]KHS89765.1 pirin [Pectobacterium brasiliense]MBN3042217.1 type II toxin-antitoxin system antitoxin CcdA [Pectobacterium brasiliense]
MKRRISIAVDKDDDYQILSAAGVNISGLVNDVIGKEAHRIKTEVWKKENREGMGKVAQFIAHHGSFADENRNW